MARADSGQPRAFSIGYLARLGRLIGCGPSGRQVIRGPQPCKF
jgi:hypothetical protein